jgi:radical SAM superfamily enzyme YgiQ (UPF0313 family)
MRTWQMEPLSVATLAGLTPKEIDIRFYDDRMEPIRFDEPTDAVAISVETYTAKRAYQIASAYRERGIPVIMGGFHASLCPNEVEQFAEAVVVGEAEAVWEEVLDDFRHGTLKKRYGTTAVRPSLTGIRPDRSIFRSKRYLPIGLVEFGRGCSYRCEFCAIQAVSGQSQSMRPVDDVVAEVIEVTQKNSLVFFVDDNFTLNVERTKEVLRKIAPLGIRWVSQASIQTSYDDELLALMAASGCQCVLVGFENLNPDALNAMNKGFNAVRGGPEQAMANFRKHGIPVYGTFLFGYEHDHAGSFAEVQSFAQDNGLFIGAFNHVTPFPGTPLYERLWGEGRLLYDKWWLSSEYVYGKIPFRPSGFEPEELEELCFEARRKFYSWRSIMNRSVARANRKDFYSARSFWLINVMHRGDIDQRKHHPLGDERWRLPLLKAV